MAITMAFIKDRYGEEVAINVDNVSSIRVTHGVVYVHLCGDKAVATDFKNIQEAWTAVNI
tara:strand:- start:396 stop:575 length:180 start_codon:yes stop_codon:yes gene_type:complete